jgi:hypothetical protein
VDANGKIMERIAEVEGASTSDTYVSRSPQPAWTGGFAV